MSQTHRRNTAAVLDRIAQDIQRATRPAPVGEERGAALERAGELFLAGLWWESRNVAEQARTEGTSK